MQVMVLTSEIGRVLYIYISHLQCLKEIKLEHAYGTVFQIKQNPLIITYL